MRRIASDYLERSIEKLPDLPGCWLWFGATDSSGYGSIRLNGKTFGAHRASWICYKGQIPEGLLILHRCDVPCCINPNHLFLGTDQDNAFDKVRKGRASSTSGMAYKKGFRKKFCKQGHPRTPDNVMISNSGCLTCKRVSQRRRIARKKNAKS